MITRIQTDSYYEFHSKTNMSKKHMNTECMIERKSTYMYLLIDSPIKAY